MVKSFMFTVVLLSSNVLFISQTYGGITDGQRQEPRRIHKQSSMERLWEGRKKRHWMDLLELNMRQNQKQRQKQYFSKHPEKAEKFSMLSCKLIALLDLEFQEERMLELSLLTGDELADKNRDALLALSEQAFDNPSEMIKDKVADVKHSINDDSNKTAKLHLELLEMLKNQ